MALACVYLHLPPKLLKNPDVIIYGIFTLHLPPKTTRNGWAFVRIPWIFFSFFVVEDVVHPGPFRGPGNDGNFLWGT